MATCDQHTNRRKALVRGPDCFGTERTRRIPAMVREAGITIPVAVTTAVFDDCVSPIESAAGEPERGEVLAPGQDIKGRLWDVLWMFTHTPRMLKHARSAKREGAQLQRAAEFIRAYCDMLEHGDRPAAFAGFVPSKDRFLQIAARKGRMVSNGYHGYYVASDEWQDNSPAAEAVRGLAANAKTPDQQQAEADQARQLEIKRMIDELRNVDIEGFFPTSSSTRPTA